MCLLWCLAESKTRFEVFLNGSEVCKGLGSENPTCLVGKKRVKAWVHSLGELSWTLILCTYKSFWFHWSTYVKLNKSACAQVKCLLLILQGLWLPLWSITPCKPLLLSLILCVCVCLHCYVTVLLPCKHSKALTCSCEYIIIDWIVSK